MKKYQVATSITLYVTHTLSAIDYQSAINQVLEQIDSLAVNPVSFKYRDNEGNLKEIKKIDDHDVKITEVEECDH